jgi:hypothetical protein
MYMFLHSEYVVTSFKFLNIVTLYVLLDIAKQNQIDYPYFT